ncbi:hypothetical protein GTB64_004456 [Salmonella enterica]|nr:hypothetical protein [Salmonella enterica]
MKMMWIICPCCEGEGRVDNPAFSNGFTQDELNDDPDFAERYFAGVYDVGCSECEGKGKVKVIDRSALSATELAELEAEEEEERAYRRMCEMERRMGA